MDIIIGAGITGLSYALFCGHSDYLILEAESQVGGYCKTIKRNGFVWDYSGHFFHFRDKCIEEIIMNRIDKNDLVNVIKQTRIIYKDNFIDYPFQKNIHQLSKQELLECLYDLFFVEKEVYTNFKEMLYVKFGKSIADKFLIPYNTKLYACDLNTLDKDAMGRFFPYAEKEDIIKNFKSKNNLSYNDTFLYPKEGAIEYINSIYNQLDKNKILTNTKVSKISPKDKTITTTNGQIFNYDKLISTIPFPILLDLTQIFYQQDIYSWNQVLVFNLGFNIKGDNKKDHWLYFPENEYCFYRVGFYDNILQQSRMSLYVEIGFNKDEHIIPSEWLGRVLVDLKKANILSEKQTLIDYEAIVMNPAYVHINSKSLLNVSENKKIIEQYDIYSIGRYGSWTYCSIEDNIKEAMNLCSKF